MADYPVTKVQPEPKPSLEAATPDMAAPDMNAPMPNRISSESMYGNVVSRYNEYGKYFQTERTMQEIAEDLMELAQFAEQTIMGETEGGDWYDGATKKRNSKEVQSYVMEFTKIAKQQDDLRKQAEYLYKDVGRVLERYFEMSNEANYDQYPNNKQEYPTDDPSDPNGEISADNRGIDRPSPAKQTVYETPEDAPQAPLTAGRDVDSQEYAKGLCERLVRLARHKLTGEQLVRFDTLHPELQIKTAWKIVK